MGRKIPKLRPGLSVNDLLDGGWTKHYVNGTRNYKEDGEMLFASEIVKIACEKLIEAANTGERVTRKNVKMTFSAIAYALKRSSETICDNMTNDKLSPTILDELANV